MKSRCARFPRATWPVALLLLLGGIVALATLDGDASDSVGAEHQEAQRRRGAGGHRLSGRDEAEAEGSLLRRGGVALPRRKVADARQGADILAPSVETVHLTLQLETKNQGATIPLASFPILVEGPRVGGEVRRLRSSTTGTLVVDLSPDTIYSIGHDSSADGRGAVPWITTREEIGPFPAGDVSLRLLFSPQAQTIAVRVESEDGMPVEGAIVDLDADSQRTDAMGRVSMAVPTFDESWIGLLRAESADGSRRTELEVTGPWTREPIVLTFPRCGELQVSATWSDGGPAAGVGLQVSSTRLQTGQSATLDALGSCLLRNVETGTCQVELSWKEDRGRGIGPGEETTWVKIEADERSSVSVELEPKRIACLVSGVTLSASGERLPWVPLLYRLEGPLALERSSSRSDGAFEIWGVPCDSVWVWPDLDGSEGTDRVRFPSGTEDAVLTVADLVPMRIALRLVEDESGLPIDAWGIRIHEPDRMGSWLVKPAEGGSGTCVFSCLPEARMELVAAGYRDKRLPMRPSESAGNPETLVVSMQRGLGWTGVFIDGDSGLPVAGASLSADGRVLGVSGPDGRVRIEAARWLDVDAPGYLEDMLPFSEGYPLDTWVELVRDP